MVRNVLHYKLNLSVSYTKELTTLGTGMSRVACACHNVHLLASSSKEITYNVNNSIVSSTILQLNKYNSI